jgi:Tfp pilus assembly protein PilF
LCLTIAFAHRDHNVTMTRKLLRFFFAMSIAGAIVVAGQTGTSGAVDVHDHLTKAAAYLKSNDADSADKELKAALELDPKNAEALANLGVIAFFRRDYQGASQYLRKALASDPSLVKTQALLGICERRLGQPSAMALLERSFPALKDKPMRVEVGLELANIYYQQSDLDGAAATMRSLVDLDPENVEILYMAQRVYSELADDTLNKLAIIAPGSARMQQVIAERLVNEGDLKGAAEHYRKALELQPHLPGVHYELAEAILQSAPTDEQTQAQAQKELETAVNLDGESSRAECLFARIAFLRSDVDGAYAHYNRAFALNPQDPEAQVGLGRLLATKQKPGDAVKYLRMAVQSDPLNEEAHYRLAAVCKDLQLTDEAKKEFRLFQDIKQAKERMEGLYTQMNKRPPGQEDKLPDAQP